MMKPKQMNCKRILSIEDEVDIQELILIYLEATEGWEVLQASNAQDGLKSAKTNQPDAILLDVMLPNINGIEIFRQLKADPCTKNIPVLFLTAKTKVTDPQKLLDLSQVKILSKPFDFEDLACQITQEIENNSSKLVA